MEQQNLVNDHVDYTHGITQALRDNEFTTSLIEKEYRKSNSMN